MKMRSKIVLCTAVALSGLSLGVVDTYLHSLKEEGHVSATCKSQPELDVCKERRIAAKGVRYFFNGQEFRGGDAPTALGANE
jgi:hypothetical protein